MRRGTIAALVAAAALIVVPAGAGAAPGCKPRAAETEELRNARIVVYSDRKSGESIACYRRTGLRKELSFADGRTAHYILRVAGPYVAFSFDEPYGADMAYVGIQVFDMKRDRERTAASGDAFAGYAVYDAVLKPSGAIAWTEGNSVHASPPKGDAGDSYAIAEGSDIEKRSLEPTRDGVRWRQDGRWRSAKVG